MTLRKPKPVKAKIQTPFDAPEVTLYAGPAVKPPETDEERIQHKVGGDAGLMAYRARMDLWKKAVK